MTFNKSGPALVLRSPTSIMSIFTLLTVHKSVLSKNWFSKHNEKNPLSSLILSNNKLLLKDK